ncbi:SPOR domain-containing protein [Porticoccus sp. GXU_MW_L64]
MRPFYGAGLFFMVLCACSTTVDKTAQQYSDSQWICDANPVTGEWDCRQVARDQLLPLPTAVAIQEHAKPQPQAALVIPAEVVPAEPPPLPVPKSLQTPQQPAAATVQSPSTPETPAPVSGKGYVVQLAALSSEAAAKRYIDQQQRLSEPLTWHHTYSQGRHWFVVTTNPISTHVEALAAAGRLEGVHPEIATWVRSLDSLRQVINRAP